MSDRESFTFTGTVWVWQARSGEKPVCRPACKIDPV